MSNLQNLSHRRGDTFDRVFNLSVDADQFVEFWFTVREEWATNEADDTSATAQVTQTAGGIVVTPPRALNVKVAATVTRDWLKKQYVYDLQGRAITGAIYTLAAGFLAMDPEATRSQ
jgi:hypothetical protein